MSRSSENLFISDNTEEPDVNNPLKFYMWLFTIGPKPYQNEFTVQMNQLWNQVLHTNSALFQQIELAEAFERPNYGSGILAGPVGCARFDFL